MSLSVFFFPFLITSLIDFFLIDFSWITLHGFATTSARPSAARGDGEDEDG